MSLPKISIVTPSYNQGSYLEQTILSIINQNYPNLEYIIIDGGSSDDSVRIIKKYESYLKYWVSEPDFGQADAINKGLLYCTGEIFNWVNSDDLLATNSLEIIASVYKKNTTIAGKVFNFYEENPSLNDQTQNKDLNFNDFLSLKSIYHQPSIWVSLEGINQIGLDITKHYYFDFIFYLDYFKIYPDIIYTTDILSHFRVHSNSKTTLIQNKSQIELINHYHQLYHTTKYKSDRKTIIKVIKHLEISLRMRTWFDKPIEDRGIINFTKFLIKNFKYLKINVFWKFVIKYYINFKNIRQKAL